MNFYIDPSAFVIFIVIVFSAVKAYIIVVIALAHLTAGAGCGNHISAGASAILRQVDILLGNACMPVGSAGSGILTVAAFPNEFYTILTGLCAIHQCSANHLSIMDFNNPSQALLEDCIASLVDDSNCAIFGCRTSFGNFFCIATLLQLNTALGTTLNFYIDPSAFVIFIAVVIPTIEADVGVVRVAFLPAGTRGGDHVSAGAGAILRQVDGFPNTGYVAILQTHLADAAAAVNHSAEDAILTAFRTFRQNREFAGSGPAVVASAIGALIQGEADRTLLTPTFDAVNIGLPCHQLSSQAEIPLVATVIILIQQYQLIIQQVIQFHSGIITGKAHDGIGTGGAGGEGIVIIILTVMILQGDLLDLCCSRHATVCTLGGKTDQAINQGYLRRGEVMAIKADFLLIAIDFLVGEDNRMNGNLRFVAAIRPPLFIRHNDQVTLFALITAHFFIISEGFSIKLEDVAITTGTAAILNDMLCTAIILLAQFKRLENDMAVICEGFRCAAVLTGFGDGISIQTGFAIHLKLVRIIMTHLRMVILTAVHFLAVDQINVVHCHFDPAMVILFALLLALEHSATAVFTVENEIAIVGFALILERAAILCLYIENSFANGTVFFPYCATAETIFSQLDSILSKFMSPRVIRAGFTAYIAVHGYLIAILTGFAKHFIAGLPLVLRRIRNTDGTFENQCFSIIHSNYHVGNGLTDGLHHIPLINHQSQAAIGANSGSHRMDIAILICVLRLGVILHITADVCPVDKGHFSAKHTGMVANITLTFTLIRQIQNFIFILVTGSPAGTGFSTYRTMHGNLDCPVILTVFAHQLIGIFIAVASLLGAIGALKAVLTDGNIGCYKPTLHTDIVFHLPCVNHRSKAAIRTCCPLHKMPHTIFVGHLFFGHITIIDIAGKLPFIDIDDFSAVGTLVNPEATTAGTVFNQVDFCLNTVFMVSVGIFETAILEHCYAIYNKGVPSFDFNHAAILHFGCTILDLQATECTNTMHGIPLVAIFVFILIFLDDFHFPGHIRPFLIDQFHLATFTAVVIQRSLAAAQFTEIQGFFGQLGVVTICFPLATSGAGTIDIAVLTGSRNGSDLGFATDAGCGAFTRLHAGGGLGGLSIFKGMLCYIGLFSTQTFTPVAVLILGPLGRIAVLRTAHFHDLDIGILSFVERNSCSIGRLDISGADMVYCLGGHGGIQHRLVGSIILTNEGQRCRTVIRSPCPSITLIVVTSGLDICILIAVITVITIMQCITVSCTSNGKDRICIFMGQLCGDNRIFLITICAAVLGIAVSHAGGRNRFLYFKDMACRIQLGAVRMAASTSIGSGAILHTGSGHQDFLVLMSGSRHHIINIFIMAADANIEGICIRGTAAVHLLLRIAMAVQSTSLGRCQVGNSVVGEVIGLKGYVTIVVSRLNGDQLVGRICARLVGALLIFALVADEPHCDAIHVLVLGQLIRQCNGHPAILTKFGYRTVLTADFEIVDGAIANLIQLFISQAQIAVKFVCGNSDALITQRFNHAAIQADIGTIQFDFLFCQIRCIHATGVGSLINSDRFGFFAKGAAIGSNTILDFTILPIMTGGVHIDLLRLAGATGTGQGLFTICLTGGSNGDAGNIAMVIDSFTRHFCTAVCALTGVHQNMFTAANLFLHSRYAGDVMTQSIADIIRVCMAAITEVGFCRSSNTSGLGRGCLLIVMCAYILFAAHITVMVVIRFHIRTGFQNDLTAIIAKMVVILGRIRMVADVHLATAVITDVVFVHVRVAQGFPGGGSTLRTGGRYAAGGLTVSMSCYISIATHITVMITIAAGICALVQHHTAAVVTYMVCIRIGIGVSSHICFATTVVTDVILVFILMIQGSTTGKGMFIIGTDCTTSTGLIIHSRAGTGCRSFFCLRLHRLNGVAVRMSNGCTAREGICIAGADRTTYAGLIIHRSAGSGRSRFQCLRLHCLQCKAVSRRSTAFKGIYIVGAHCATDTGLIIHCSASASSLRLQRLTLHSFLCEAMGSRFTIFKSICIVGAHCAADTGLIIHCSASASSLRLQRLTLHSFLCEAMGSRFTIFKSICIVGAHCAADTGLIIHRSACAGCLRLQRLSLHSFYCEAMGRRLAVIKGVCIVGAHCATCAGLIIHRSACAGCLRLQCLGLYHFLGIGMGQRLSICGSTVLTSFRHGAGGFIPTVPQRFDCGCFYLSTFSTPAFLNTGFCTSCSFCCRPF